MDLVMQQATKSLSNAVEASVTAVNNIGEAALKLIHGDITDFTTKDIIETYVLKLVGECNQLAKDCRDLMTSIEES